MCREQLKRSHGLRLQGQKALDELKSEFEALTKDLAGDAAASLSATSAMTHGAPWISFLDPTRTCTPTLAFHVSCQLPVVQAGSRLLTQ